MKYLKLYEQFDKWDPFGEESTTTTLMSITQNTIIEVGDKLYHYDTYFGSIIKIKTVFNPYTEGVFKSEEYIFSNERGGGSFLMMTKGRLISNGFKIKK